MRSLVSGRSATLALVGLLLALVLLELLLRLFTISGSFAGFPLLPLDPAAPVKAARGTDFTKTYLVFDADLGWSVGPDRKSTNGLYQSTSFGARLDPSAPPTKPTEGVWAVAFGDSFTHGDDVSGANTWEHYLSHETGHVVLNFGVPGYGVDQALLRYRKMSRSWPSELVLIGLMADNIGRHCNRYRPFISPAEGIFFVKPRFVRRDDTLVLIPSPFRDLEAYFGAGIETKLEHVGAYDDWYEPERYEAKPWDLWRTVRVIRTLRALRPSKALAWRSLYKKPEAVDLTLRLVRAFVAEVRSDQREPVVVFFPDRSLCRDALRGAPRLPEGLLYSLASSGVPVVDLTDPLLKFLGNERSLERHFLPHYSRELNEVAGRYLARRLGTAITSQAPLHLPSEVSP